MEKKEFDIYEVEILNGKKGEYAKLKTSEGNLFGFENQLGNLSPLLNLKGKCVLGTINLNTQYPTLLHIEKELGKAGKVKDKNNIITRIACLNTAIKTLEIDVTAEKKTEKEVTELAERYFEFVNK